MPNTNPTVSLDIRSSNCGTPAYTHASELVAGTPNPGGLSYSYNYTGGTDQQGNVEEPIGQGAVVITVNITADPRYKMADIIFSTTTHPQISKSVQGNGRTGRLTDAATAAETDDYKVMVTDTGNGNCQFYCDPRITNK